MSPAKAPGSDAIDAVYTWDGKGNLRYALRSIGRHAPWVRKVYVVTGAAAPKWLARTHERLALVKPEDLVRDSVATADAIRWQLFRIPGLSRQFLYCDGNWLLGCPLAAADFLTPKGGYRFPVESADLPPGGAAEALLNGRFGNRSPRKQVAACPQLFDRNFLEEVHRLWEKNIRQGGVSLETLYFYFLVENPLQRGAHEKIALADDGYGRASLSEAKQVKEMLARGLRFLALEGSPSFMTRIALLLHFWRKSAYEK